MKKTAIILSDKIVKLEGAQEPPMNEITPVNRVLVISSSSTKPTLNNQQALPPDRKLYIVVYGLEENLSNTTRQDRLQMDVKSVISAFSKLQSPPIDESLIQDCYRLG